ncbi:hypothetical protein [Burkholderia ubonensis]|uniref:hypothetical protein n=1 Tax=Burkholderia ubonensis TaxID=101571 RepID=UPI0012FBE18E|nr:hypothetical protein [Burkholderia ubonensis]
MSEEARVLKSENMQKRQVGAHEGAKKDIFRKQSVDTFRLSQDNTDKIGGS